jgi:hypothetical protein
VQVPFSLLASEPKNCTEIVDCTLSESVAARSWEPAERVVESVAAVPVVVWTEMFVDWAKMQQKMQSEVIAYSHSKRVPVRVLMYGIGTGTAPTHFAPWRFTC